MSITPTKKQLETQRTSTTALPWRSTSHPSCLANGEAVLPAAQITVQGTNKLVFQLHAFRSDRRAPW